MNTQQASPKKNDGQKPATPQRGFWSRQLRQWHWISSALALSVICLFAVTGITLNHAGYFEGEPSTQLRDIELSGDLTALFSEMADGEMAPAAAIAALKEETGLNIAGRPATEEFGELTFDLGGPGVNSYLLVDTAAGFANYERIDRGAVAILNDLHKGRDSGLVWGVLIDVAAGVCVLFSLTGFGLLWISAKARPSTWPLTTLGLIAPLIAYILFAHA